MSIFENGDGVDDTTFLAVEKLNNPARYEATRQGINPCPCVTCRRLRLAFAAVNDAVEAELEVFAAGGADFGPGVMLGPDTILSIPEGVARRIDVPLPDGVSADDIKAFFQAMGFDVVDVQDMRAAPALDPVGRGAPRSDAAWAARRSLALDGTEGSFRTDTPRSADAGMADFLAALSGTRGEAFSTFGEAMANAPIDRGFSPEPESEHEARKNTPVAAGVLAYFPDAIHEVARVSKKGNDRHNPGEPLHWDREKSTDEADALTRHLTDYLGGEGYDSDDVPHLAKVAWRALALLQRWCDGEYPQGYRP